MTYYQPRKRRSRPKPDAAPVKTWAQMTEEEKAKIRATTKPLDPKFRLPSTVNQEIVRASRRYEALMHPEDSMTITELNQKIRDEAFPIPVTRLKHKTEKAELWVCPGGSEVWIPESIIVEHRQDDKGYVAQVYVQRWFAKKEGYCE